MALRVRIRIHGLPELERKLGPRVIDPPIQRFLTRSAINVQGNMRKRVRVDTGRGRNSIAYEVEKRKARIGTNLEYLEVMARGRRPGRAMPPPGALLGWMRRHGIAADREFLIRRAIGRRGIAGDDFDTKAFADSIPQIERNLRFLARDIERAMGAA
jgi:hypothetical protein